MAAGSITASLKAALRALILFIGRKKCSFEDNPFFIGYGTTKQKEPLKYKELFHPVTITHGPFAGRLALISDFKRGKDGRVIAYYLNVEDSSSSPGNRRFYAVFNIFNDYDVAEAPPEVVAEIAKERAKGRLAINYAGGVTVVIP